MNEKSDINSFNESKYLSYGAILNVEFHRAHLLISALNRAKTIKKAAKLLNISERQIYEWMHRFDVDFHVGTDMYFLKKSFYEFYDKYERKTNY